MCAKFRICLSRSFLLSLSPLSPPLCAGNNSSIPGGHIEPVRVAHGVTGFPPLYFGKIQIARRDNRHQALSFCQLMGQSRVALRNDEGIVGETVMCAHCSNRNRAAALVCHTNYGQTLSVDRPSDNFHVSLNGEFYPCTVTEEMPQLHTAGYRGHNRRVHRHRTG